MTEKRPISPKNENTSTENQVHYIEREIIL